jgi:hypothetical protein
MLASRPVERGDSMSIHFIGGQIDDAPPDGDALFQMASAFIPRARPLCRADLWTERVRVRHLGRASL